MISTENALDIAIEGQGHFQILQADGNFVIHEMVGLCFQRRVSL